MEQVRVDMDYLVALQILATVIRVQDVLHELEKLSMPYTATLLREKMAEVDRCRPTGMPPLLRDESLLIVTAGKPMPGEPQPAAVLGAIAPASFEADLQGVQA